MYEFSHRAIFVGITSKVLVSVVTITAVTAVLETAVLEIALSNNISKISNNDDQMIRLSTVRGQ